MKKKAKERYFSNSQKLYLEYVFIYIPGNRVIEISHLVAL
jgi:hypothetical protein